MVAGGMRQSISPILAVEGYSKSYGKKRVVEDVALSVLPGSIFGFVGHNGAGKTTLIRSIVGALSFDEGDIRICGNRSARIPSPASGCAPTCPTTRTSMAFSQACNTSTTWRTCSALVPMSGYGA